MYIKVNIEDIADDEDVEVHLITGYKFITKLMWIKDKEIIHSIWKWYNIDLGI